VTKKLLFLTYQFQEKKLIPSITAQLTLKFKQYKLGQ
jgi:hypothetical protein